MALGLALAGSAIVVLGGGGAEIETIGHRARPLHLVRVLGLPDRHRPHVKTTDPLTAATWLGIGAAIANLVYAVAFDAVVVPAARVDWWRLARR